MNDIWKTYKLGDIGTIVGGATPSTFIDKYYGGNIPWLTPKDLSNFHERYITQGERNITQEGLESCSAQLLPQNTILFSSRAPIGYVAIAKNPVATNQGFKSVIPNEKIVSYLFLYYLLVYNKNRIEAVGSGTTFKEVSASTMRNIPISLPPLETQKRIADILSAIDDKIELNRRINANLEQQAQALYKSWFVDFEFPNEEGKPYKSSGGKMQESELGLIPKGWNIDKLGNKVVIKRGGSPRPIQDFLALKGLRWLKISDATAEPSPYIYKIKEFIKEEGLSKTVFLNKGELVLSNSATPGLPKLLGLDTCIHDGWLYFPKSDFSKEYLFELFLFEREKILSQANGSVFSNLKTDILKALTIIVPQENVLNRFQNIIGQIFRLIQQKQEEIISLTTLRDTLLPELMSGEITISSSFKL